MSEEYEETEYKSSYSSYYDYFDANNEEEVPIVPSTPTTSSKTSNSTSSDSNTEKNGKSSTQHKYSLVVVNEDEEGEKISKRKDRKKEKEIKKKVQELKDDTPPNSLPPAFEDLSLQRKDEDRREKERKEEGKRILYGLKLKDLRVFNEIVDVSNRSTTEKYYNLSRLSYEAMEFLITRNRSWGVELSQEEDSLLFPSAPSSSSSSLPNATQTTFSVNDPDDLLLNDNDQEEREEQTILIAGDSGTGKTCLLRHLFCQSRAFYQQNRKTKDQKNDMRIAFYICAKALSRSLLDPSFQSRSFLDILSNVALQSILSPFSLILNCENDNNNNNNNCKEINIEEEKNCIDKEKKIGKERIREEIKRAMKEERVLLLIDNLELVGMKGMESLMKRLSKESLIREGIQHSQRVMTINTNSLQVIEDRKVKLYQERKYRVYLLTPGPSFNVQTTHRTKGLMNRWEVTEKLLPLGGITPQFESSIRYYRDRVFPDYYHSPILLYCLTWKLVHFYSDDDDPTLLALAPHHYNLFFKCLHQCK